MYAERKSVSLLLAIKVKEFMQFAEFRQSIGDNFHIKYLRNQLKSNFTKSIY